MILVVVVVWADVGVFVGSVRMVGRGGVGVGIVVVVEVFWI